MVARTSSIGMNVITYTLQLVLDKDGGARMTRTPGKMSSDERSIELTVSLPKSIFSRPSLKAEIAVQAADVSIPPIKVDAVRGAIRDAFGADVLLTVQTQEQP